MPSDIRLGRPRRPGEPLLHIAPASIWFTLLLGALSATAPLSIDIGLPALPGLAAALHTSAANAGLTLSLFVAGFGIAQLVFGPLSDRFGRRWVLIAGTSFFTVAAFASASANSFAAVLIWRFAQGIGGAASAVLSIAIVRDVFDGAAARARLSYAMMVLSISPIVAPSVGGLLACIGGWRAIYFASALLGCALTLTVWLGLEESHRTPDRAAIRPSRLIANYRRAIASPACFGHALVGGLTMGCLFAYVSGSPIMLIDIYGVSTSTYGLLFGASAGGIMIGAALAGRLATRGVRPQSLIGRGLVIALVAAAVLIVLTEAGRPPLAVLISLLVANTFCVGLIAANITHAAIEGLPQIAGTTTALVGCVRMLCAAVSSAMAAFMMAALGLPGLPITMAGFAAGALIVWWFYARPASINVK